MDSHIWSEYGNMHCTKKWSFPLRVSSLNVTKPAGNCGFGHIWRINLHGKLVFCVVIKTAAFSTLSSMDILAYSKSMQTVSCFWNIYVAILLGEVWKLFKDNNKVTKKMLSMSFFIVIIEQISHLILVPWKWI